MHGQSGGLACRQWRIQAFEEAFEQTLGDGQLLRMQIGHLRAKRVLDALPSAHPLDGPVDVVRRRDHGQRRKAGAEAAHGGSEQLGDQRQPLRRDLGEHLRHGGGVPHRDEAPDHPVRLDRIPGWARKPRPHPVSTVSRPNSSRASTTSLLNTADIRMTPPGGSRPAPISRDRRRCRR